ncbi:MAG: MarR family transcriptional regulator [Actinobacteria bacterium]|nr:MarR family transcriptional regulator [Actinomycetota bacterium]
MDKTARGPEDQLPDLVLSIFRLNGFLQRVGDRLTAGSGLTTARWQVLGAVLHEPLTVAAIARNMGLARQSVQRTADLLVKAGLCQYSPNPAHRRAKLLSSTDHGLDSVRRLGPSVSAWSKRMRESVGDDVIHAATVSVKELTAALARDEAQLLGDD